VLGIPFHITMRVFDPLLFLAGHRGAIERIAATRHAWLVGAILVLSAGIARNYDHLDLLKQSEWFIGPFIASLVSINVIFFCIKGPLRLLAVGPEGKQFATFLTFAWMTAPCAWLYGIPVESMTDLVTATKWNIAFLAIVSLWRVALMTRAVAVLTGVTNLRAFVLILAPAAFESMIGSTMKGMSLVQIMGGVRLPPHTQLLRDASQFIAGASFWIFLAMVVLCWIVKGRATSPFARTGTSAPWTSANVAMVLLLIWTAIAAPLQPLAANQHRLETLVWEGDPAPAVEFASARQRKDFLPDHEFPGSRRALELLELTTPETPAWLKQEWISAAIEDSKSPLSLRQYRMKDEVIGRRWPEIPAAIHQYAVELRSRENRLSHDERWWLNNYKSTFESAPPPDRFDPTKLPSPEK
jgi:hypothetical protein